MPPIRRPSMWSTSSRQAHRCRRVCPCLLLPVSTARPSPPRSSSSTATPARWSARVGRRTPTAPRSTPRRGGRPSRPPRPDDLLDRRGGDRGRRAAARHGRSRRATARWCGRRCSGTTPGRPRTPHDLIAELGGPARVGRRDRAPYRSRASPSPSCAGSPAHEPQNAARVATRRAAARLADLASRAGRRRAGRPTAATRPAPATGRRAAGDYDRSTCSSSPSAASDVALPRVLGPAEAAGDDARTARSWPRAPATTPARRSASRPASGDVVVSIGTSGVVCAVADKPTADADRPRRRLRRRDRSLPATGRARSTRPGCSTPSRRCSASTCDEFDDLALSAPAGAGGLVLLPYLDGERTPDLPDRHRPARAA